VGGGGGDGGAEGEASGEKRFDIDPSLPFWEWLLEYVVLAYPDDPAPERTDEGNGIFWHGVDIDDNGQFFMAWWQGNDEQHALSAVTSADDPPGGALYIGTADDKGWTEGVEYTPGVGYYIPSYDPGAHGGFNIGGTCVIQLNTDSATAAAFVEKMVAEKR
jgi:hypothetical protein